MFASLIRRKSAGSTQSEVEAAFESTSVSLSTGVPRPVERREDERISAMLRVGKMIDASGDQQLIRLKNMSAGGIMAIVSRPPVIGEQVQIELSSQKIPSTVVWTREDLIGFKFNGDVDLGELLAGRKPRGGVAGPAPPAPQGGSGSGQSRDNK